MGLAISSSAAAACTTAAVSFDDFENYLKAQNRSNVKQIMSYARRYGSILSSGDASTLIGAKPAVRRHTLESLALLSKYEGKHNLFKDICAKYQLRWESSNEDNLRYFTNYLVGHGNIDVMMSWLKDALHKLPKQTGNVLLHNIMTGMRPSENIFSIKLIKTDFEHYANKEVGILQNFLYPDFFLRKTKKCFITAYDDVTLDVANKAADIRSWKALRSQLKRRGLESHLKYCRAIFATYLRKQGIEQEIIDLYQGRVPSTVFQASYLKTNIKEDRERILKAVHRLKEEIGS